MGGRYASYWKDFSIVIDNFWQKIIFYKLQPQKPNQVNAEAYRSDEAVFIFLQKNFTQLSNTVKPLVKIYSKQSGLNVKLTTY